MELFPGLIFASRNLFELGRSLPESSWTSVRRR